MAEKAYVTTKGQFVIPARLRRRLGIRSGTVLAVDEENGRLVAQPLTPEFIDRMKGSLKGDPSPLQHLLDERKKDRLP